MQRATSFSSAWFSHQIDYRLCKEVYCKFKSGASVDQSNTITFEICPLMWKIEIVTHFCSHNMLMLKGISIDISMHCPLSITQENICVVQNKSLSSDMQVSRTQREALHPVAGSITGLWQMLILLNCISWYSMYRPVNDFMQEEAEGQPITRSSHTHSLYI